MNQTFTISREMTAFMDSMHNPVLVIDDAGILIACNRSAEQIIRHPRQTLLGRPLTAILETSRLHTILKPEKPNPSEK